MPFTMNGQSIQEVSHVKYLSHYIFPDMKDNVDVLIHAGNFMYRLPHLVSSSTTFLLWFCHQAHSKVSHDCTIQPLPPSVEDRVAMETRYSQIDQHELFAKGVERRSTLSLEEFDEIYDGKWPVIITDVVPNWKAAKWSKAFFSKHHADEYVNMQTFRAPSERQGHRVALREFITKIDQATPEEWSYVTDELFIPLRPHLRRDIGDMHYFKEDFYTLFPAELRPWNAMLLWGSQFSMSPLHVDPYNWTGTNAVIYGVKKWKMFPPGQDEYMCVTRNMKSGFPLDCWKYNSDADSFHPDNARFPLLHKAVSIDFDQVAGDLLVIPPGWYHQAYNVEETMAIGGEVMNKNNYRIVLEEILKYGDVQRSCLPANMDQLPAKEQVKAMLDCVPKKILEQGRAMDKAHRDMMIKEQMENKNDEL